MTADTAVPRPVRQAATAVLVVAAVHVLALTLLVLNRGALFDAAADQHPDWAADRVQDLADGRFLQSLVPHVVLAVALTVRALGLRGGRSRGRRVLTGLLGLQLLAHATFPLQLQMLPTFVGPLLLVQGFSLVFEAAALWLLWHPAASRAWFAGRGGGRPAGRRGSGAAQVTDGASAPLRHDVTS